MPNKITLVEASNIHIGELANLPTDQLLDLQRKSANHLEKAKRAKQWIDSAIKMQHQNKSTLQHNQLNKGK